MVGLISLIFVNVFVRPEITSENFHLKKATFALDVFRLFSLSLTVGKIQARYLLLESFLANLEFVTWSKPNPVGKLLVLHP